MRYSNSANGIRILFSYLKVNYNSSCSVPQMFAVYFLQIFLKAHFTYDPKRDSLIPCREAGLPFRMGEILEVVNRDDPNWWQVNRCIKICFILLKLLIDQQIFIWFCVVVRTTKMLGCFLELETLHCLCIMISVLKLLVTYR